MKSLRDYQALARRSRLNTLFTSRPDAGEALEAAVSFGQADDITVLTLTKLGIGEASAPQRTAPMLSPA
jgi:hypothetical protein